MGGGVSSLKTGLTPPSSASSGQRPANVNDMRRNDAILQQYLRKRRGQQQQQEEEEENGSDDDEGGNNFKQKKKMEKALAAKNVRQWPAVVILSSTNSSIVAIEIEKKRKKDAENQKKRGNSKQFFSNNNGDTAFFCCGWKINSSSARKFWRKKDCACCNCSLPLVTKGMIVRNVSWTLMGHVGWKLHAASAFVGSGTSERGIRIVDVNVERGYGILGIICGHGDLGSMVAERIGSELLPRLKQSLDNNDDARENNKCEVSSILSRCFVETDEVLRHEWFAQVNGASACIVVVSLSTGQLVIANVGKCVALLVSRGEGEPPSTTTATATTARRRINERSNNKNNDGDEDLEGAVEHQNPHQQQQRTLSSSTTPPPLPSAARRGGNVSFSNSDLLPSSPVINDWLKIAERNELSSSPPPPSSPPPHPPPQQSPLLAPPSEEPIIRHLCLPHHLRLNSAEFARVHNFGRFTKIHKSQRGVKSPHLRPLDVTWKGTTISRCFGLFRVKPKEGIEARGDVTSIPQINALKLVSAFDGSLILASTRTLAGLSPSLIGLYLSSSSSSSSPSSQNEEENLQQIAHSLVISSHRAPGLAAKEASIVVGRLVC